MPLDATQKSFLTGLGVVERKKEFFHIRSKDEVRNDKIIGVTDDYLRREAKVLEAIDALGKVTGTTPIVTELEQQVSAIQTEVTTASPDTAAKVIESAYEKLEVIKDKARDLATNAGSNADFYASLDVATKALAALEQHAHKDCVAASLGTARSAMTQALGHAKNARFTDAANAVTQVTDACTAGKNIADQLAPLFVRATDAKQKRADLNTHAQTGKIVAEKFNADAALRTFGTESVAGKVAQAGVALASAETACRDGKQKADDFAAFYLKATASQQKLDALNMNLRKAEIANQIKTATDALKLATDEAAKGALDTAAVALGEADAACVLAAALAPIALRVALAKPGLEELKTHPQHAHITGKTDEAGTKFALALTEINAGMETAADTAATEGQAACTSAKEIAEGFAAFHPKAAETQLKIDALNMNLRKAEIASQIKTATDELKLANDEAAKNKLDTAKAALGRADAACVLAAKLAPIALKVALATPGLEDLKKLPQRAHIKDRTDLATTKFALVLTKITAGDEAAAETAFTEGQAACLKGKSDAADYQKVVDKLAEVKRCVAGLRIVNAKAATQYDTKTTNAFAGAAAPGRGYAAATTALQDIVDALKIRLGKLVMPPDPVQPLDPLKPREPPKAGSKAAIDALATKIAGITATPTDAAPGATFAQDVVAARASYTKAETTLNGGDLRLALMQRSDTIGMLTDATKAADRRLKYDAERVRTQAEIEKLKTRKALLGQIFSMQQLITRADGLATRTAMRMEDGIAELQNITKTCKQLTDVATKAEAYFAERTRADNEVSGLRGAAGASAIAVQLTAIDKLLGDARKMTGAVELSGFNPNNLQQDWGAALKLVEQARAEIKAADAVAGGATDTLATKKTVGKATDATKIAEAEAALRKQATEAQKHKDHDLATKEYTALFLALDAALAQAKGDHIDVAQAKLEEAADLLVTAKGVQTQHAQFDTAYQALDLRFKALTALTDPPAVQLKGMVDPIGVSLTGATTQDTARDWAKAGAALRAADDAAKAAEEFRDMRKKFNADLALAEQAATPLTQPLKGAVLKMIGMAKAEADKFDINYATRYLENAQAQIAGAKVSALAKTNPDSQEFSDAIDKMLAARGGNELAIKQTYDESNPAPFEVDPVKAKQMKELPGGAELLDQIVAKLTATGTPEEVAKVTKAIAKIAEKRFGLDLAISVMKQTTPGNFKEELPTNIVGTDTIDVKGSEIDTVEPVSVTFDTKRGTTAQKIYEMLARVPEQAEKNPSMQRFARKDAYKTNGDGTLKDQRASGGYYQAKGDLVAMSGRVGDASKQKFGSKANQLPVLDDPVYAPVNEDEVDYFDFASVHEVGHAVDDRMGFMSSREGNAAFGGWKTYGGAIGPIAKAVSADVVRKNAGAVAVVVEQFVSDLMAGASPDTPAVNADVQVATTAACNAAKTWHTTVTGEQLWWNQGQTDSVTIEGIVYQQAYAGTWVSYPAAERKKGITGYQFRAPGEWFAELYAAYHMGKLKNGHPARRWLSSLSL